MATMPAQVDDATLIRGFVDAVTPPPGVKFKRIELDSDSEGKPAYRIYFAVSLKLPLTPKRLDALNALRKAIQEQVFEAGISEWPFVHFLDAK